MDKKQFDHIHQIQQQIDDEREFIALANIQRQCSNGSVWIYNTYTILNNVKVVNGERCSW